jgi:hypothetical protein
MWMDRALLTIFVGLESSAASRSGGCTELVSLSRGRRVYPTRNKLEAKENANRRRWVAGRGDDGGEGEAQISGWPSDIKHLRSQLAQCLSRLILAPRPPAGILICTPPPHPHMQSHVFARPLPCACILDMSPFPRAGLPRGIISFSLISLFVAQ